MAVAFVASEGEHTREVCAHQAFQLFKLECIDCHLVASVKSWSWWIKWFLLSEDWIGWCPCGSNSLSGSLCPSQDGWDGLFKVFADEGG